MTKKRPDQSDSGVLLKRSAVMKLLGVCRHTLRRYELLGLLPAVKINSRFTCYREADVLKLIADSTYVGGAN